MIEKRDIARALSKCSGYDPGHFSQASDVILMAWLEHFEQYPSLTGDDLLDAVKVYYRTPDRRVPQPADISTIAREHRRTRPETQAEIDARNLANDRRLGLETDWARELSPSEISSADQRRSVIEQFTRDIGARALPAVDTRRETVAEKVARIRAESPPQPLGPTDDQKVAEDGAQPQESAP